MYGLMKAQSFYYTIVLVMWIGIAGVAQSQDVESPCDYPDTLVVQDLNCALEELFHDATDETTIWQSRDSRHLVFVDDVEYPQYVYVQRANQNTALVFMFENLQEIKVELPDTTHHPNWILISITEGFGSGMGSWDHDLHVLVDYRQLQVISSFYSHYRIAGRGTDVFDEIEEYNSYYWSKSFQFNTDSLLFSPFQVYREKTISNLKYATIHQFSLQILIRAVVWGMDLVRN